MKRLRDDLCEIGLLVLVACVPWLVAAWIVAPAARSVSAAAPCGCGERACAMPCSSCCPGAGPEGCPPPPTVPR